MRYFPAFVDTRQLRVLIVGAGEVAARKLELMLKTEASITIVAPLVCNAVRQLVAPSRVLLEQRPYRESDLDNQNMVFVATDDSLLNEHIYHHACARNILVNVVDNTPLCRFITPSIIDRSPVVVALSSGGTAPVLLRYLRQKLEATLPAGLAKLASFSDKFRDLVKASFHDVTARRYFWESVLESDVAEEVVTGLENKAERRFLEQLEAAKGNVHTKGTVYLVGAGPGDPDLLTFRALRIMQKADVVVYDRLVSKDVVELVRRDAEKIYVGKEKSNHTLPQDDINQLLIRCAKEGKRVVRLKGGDPFIFGRGGEEIQSLIAAGIDFQVVPGITAAVGASSYAGIPLTHRDHAQAVTFVTGHLREGSIDLDWQRLAGDRQTLVFYMGLTGLSVICERLMYHGMPSSTPVALVHSATTPEQRIVTGSLNDIVTVAHQHSLSPPTLIIVGTVVSLQKELHWFKQ